MKKYLILSSFVLAASTSVLQATVLFWSGNGTTLGGGGTWDSTNPRWGISTAGPFTTVWNNANVDSATFNGTAGSVAVGTVTIAVNTITMNVSGYTFSAGNILAFSGAGCGVNCNHSSGTTTLSIKFTSSTSFTKSGAGRLELNNSTAAPTKYIITGGFVGLAAVNRLGTVPGSLLADYLNLNGGGVGCEFSGDLGANAGVTIGVNGAFFGGSSSANIITISAPIVGTAGGALTVGGSVFYSPFGPCVVQPGNTGNSWNGATIISSGGQITLGAAGVIPDTSAVTVSGTLAMNGFNETVGAVTLSGGTISGTGTLTGSSYGLQSGTCSSILAGSGVSATKTTSGTVTLTVANTFTGGLTISSTGVLRIGNNAALGTGKLTISGGTLSGNGATARTLSVPVDLSANVILGNSTDTANLIFQTGAWTITGATRQITVDTSTVTINSAIGQDAAGRGLTLGASTTGTLILGSAANTYSGPTTLSAGTLSVGTTATFGDGTGTLNLSGGTLNTTGSRTPSTAPIANPINLTANTAITTTSTAGAVDLNFSSSSIGGSAGTMTLRNDAASGTGVFQPRFSAGFTFGRPIVINNGSFGTTLLQSFNTTGNDQTFNGVISGTGSYKRTATTSGTGGNTIFTAANAWSGGTTLNDGGLGLGVDSVGTPPALTSGPIGIGTLTIGAANGSIFASGSARTVGNAITFSSSPLVVNGANDITLSGAVSLGASTRTLQTDNTGATELAGIVGSTGGGLTKTGSGQLKLSNADTYSGDTTISAGTLALTGGGSINSSPNIINNASLDVSGHSGGSYTLASGQTLKGNGGVNGTIVVASGATVAPGTSIGTLTFNNAPTLSGTTSMEINRGAAPNADKLVVVSGGGTLAYGGTLTVANLGAALQLNDTFDLFDADGFSGSFSSVNLPSTPAGLAWDTSQLGVDGTIKVICSGTVAANAGSNTNICSGGSAQLNASASGGSGTGYTFSWSPATGLSSTSISNPVASPGSTATYTVTVTDSFGCTAQSSVTVSLDVAPTITAQPASTTNCSGTTATLTVGATGSGLSYSWAKHNNGGWGSAWSASGSGATFRQTSTQNNSGDGACTGFSSANDINSPSGNALGMWGGFSGDEVATRDFAGLSAGQDVSVDFDNGNVDGGSKAGFSLEDSSGSDILQFYFLGGQSNYKYWDTANSEQDTGIGFQRTGMRVQFILLSSGSYKLILTTCGGSTSTFTGSYSGTISRLKLFNQNNTGGDDKNIYFNNFIVGGYTDNADNYSGDYEGQDKGDQPIPTGNGGGSYTTPALSVADSGTQYEVVVYGCSGTVVSSAATLTVNPAATVSAGPNQTVCAESPTTTLAGNYGGGASSATWSGGAGTFTPDNTTTNATYTPSVGEIAAGTVTLTLTTDDPSGPCGAVNASMTITIDQVTATNVTFVRAPNSSLKISKTNLLAHASDRDAETLTFAGAGADGVNLMTTNGATLLTDANWIFYTNSATPNVNDSFAYKVTDARGCIASGTVFINVLLNQSGQSTGIVVSNGVAILDFAGIPGRSYQVQRSTNLVDWVTLVTTNAPASGVFRWVDDFSDLGVPPADPPSSAYYQLRVP